MVPWYQYAVGTMYGGYPVVPTSLHYSRYFIYFLFFLFALLSLSLRGIAFVALPSWHSLRGTVFVAFSAFVALFFSSFLFAWFQDFHLAPRDLDYVVPVVQHNESITAHRRPLTVTKHVTNLNKLSNSLSFLFGKLHLKFK